MSTPWRIYVNFKENGFEKDLIGSICLITIGIALGIVFLFIVNAFPDGTGGNILLPFLAPIFMIALGTVVIIADLKRIKGKA